jgi:hypothetical protein
LSGIFNVLSSKLEVALPRKADTSPKQIKQRYLLLVLVDQLLGLRAIEVNSETVLEIPRNINQMKNRRITIAYISACTKAEFADTKLPELVTGELSLETSLLPWEDSIHAGQIGDCPKVLQAGFRSHPAILQKPSLRVGLDDGLKTVSPLRRQPAFQSFSELYRDPEPIAWSNPRSYPTSQDS